MTTTFTLPMVPSREAERPDVQSRQALKAATDHLLQTVRHLCNQDPDYAGALRNSHQAIRQAYAALLAWNSMPLPPKTPLIEVAHRAERLISMLANCQNQALIVDALAGSFRKEDRLTVAVREQIETSYYTARNLLSVVLGSLPEHVSSEAIWALNRAQALWIGRATSRLAAPPPERKARPVSGAQSRPRPVALV